MRYVWPLLLSLLMLWATLVVFLLVARPKGSLVMEALRILPDTIRLLRRLVMDRGLPRGVRARLWLVFIYLAIPINLIPDFIPVIGYVDDAIIVCAVLRSVVRRAGPEGVRGNWPGTQDGLEALWRVARLPGTAPLIQRSASGR